MKTWSDLGIDIPASTPGPNGDVYTTCPWCSASRKKKNVKCLSVNLEKNAYLCHHCGKSGGLGGRDTRVDSGWRKPAYIKPQPTPQGMLPEQVVQWFTQRGIEDWVLDHFQIGWQSVYMPQLEGHQHAIVFPYFRDGELINRKYRTLDKQFRMDTGAERILYGLDEIGETVTVVEGECDRLSVAMAGELSCVSVPDGAPAVGTKDYSSKFTFLDSAEAQLAGVKKFILAVDNDPPGVLLEDELARRLGRERCWRVKWPDGCKDANDVLVKHGAEDLKWYLDSAEPYPIEGVFTALGEQGKVFALYHNGLERGQSTGWSQLDPFYTVRPGEFTVVIGIPGSGKSNFVDALFVNLAKLHGWSFAMFSPENQPLEDHIARIVEKYVGRPFTDGPTPRMDEHDLDSGLHWVNDHFYWMLPNDEGSWDVDWILARARQLVYRYGIRGLVIDPWNELESHRAKTETETEYISRVLRGVRQFGRRHGVHVFLVVHPTKMRRDDTGKYPIPTLWDASGSAHFRNKADNGLCVWRDLSGPDLPEVDIHVQKIRFRQIGRTGKATLYYQKATATYRQATPVDYADEEAEA